MTTTITIVIVLAAVGILVWLVHNYAPVVPKTKFIIYGVMGLCTVLWLVRRLIP